VRRISELCHKAVKLLRILSRSDYRHAIRQGVAAAVEHEQVVFPRTYRSVIDVGANRGQFALFALRRFPEASLTCFEPLPAAHSKLHAVVGHDAKVSSHQCAVGAKGGSLSLNVTRSDDSSSLLKPTALQLRTFRDTDTVSSTQVDVVSLDDVIDLGGLAEPFLLKIDVQGYELEVLRGAEQLLQKDGDVLVEASFAEFYEGQALIDEVVVEMYTSGYRLRGIFSIAKSSDGTPLQGDLLFSRGSAPGQ
jgi:FkbM family methyltransferase